MIVRVELNNLNKKIQQKEIENDELTQNYEDVINEYKISLEKCISVHNTVLKKLKEKEEREQLLNRDLQELVNSNSLLERELNITKRELGEEKDENQRVKQKLNNLNDTVKTLVNMVVEYSKSFKPLVALDHKFTGALNQLLTINQNPEL